MTKKFTIIIPILTFAIFYILLFNYVMSSFISSIFVMNMLDERDESEYLNRSVEQEDDFIPVITIDRTEHVIVDYRYNITEKEFKEFVRVVEAEVTGDNPFGVDDEDAYESKLRVAQVILNRVESPHFPDTVHDVIFQKNAFTPLLDGRYYEVEISDITIQACKDALLSTTPDLTDGCEFFSSGTKTCLYGSYNFTDAVGHSFFNSYRSY